MGANGHGQLGIGSVSEKMIPSDMPVRLSLEPDLITDVGGGGGFSYILTGSGLVFTCGNNSKGQLGQDNKEDVFSLCHCLSQVKVIKATAGWDFMLVLSDTGCVLSWGSNCFGQLGRILKDGATYDTKPGKVAQVCPLQGNQVDSLPGNKVDIAAGLRHAVSLSDDGRVFTWGHGRRGQLGALDNDKRPLIKTEYPIPVNLTGIEKPVQVFAGMHHSGLLTGTGSIFMWGCNKFGQCGLNPNDSQTVLIPNKVLLPTQLAQDNVVSVASGWTHVIARTDSGALYSWGRADLGQLGRLKEKSCDHIPDQVTGLPSVKSHSCGSEHTLAATENGQVYTWGWNEHSICGTEHEENLFQPYLVQHFVGKHVSLVGCGTGHSFCVAVDTIHRDTS